MNLYGNVFSTVSKVLLVGAAFAAVTFGFGISAKADEVKVIAVSSVAEKSMEPDLLHLNIEVWSKAANGQRAQTLAAAETKRIFAVVDQFKVKKEDIQTENYSFGPEYIWDQQKNQNRLNGFRSTQTFRVTLRKVADAGKFIDALTMADKTATKAEAGSNVNNIQWDSSKKAEAEAEAVADAVKMARRKAEDMAKAAGVKIKGLQSLSHFAAQSEGPRPMMKRGRAAMMEMAADSGGTAMAEGQVKVQASVSAEYEIDR